MYKSTLHSPIGILLIQADEVSVRSIQFVENEIRQDPSELTEWAKIELSAYFEGKLSIFTFPMQQEGSPFQQGFGKNSSKLNLAAPLAIPTWQKDCKTPWPFGQLPLPMEKINS